MTRDDINNAYHAWLYDLVCSNRYSNNVSYHKLLMHLHRTEFRYLIPRDRNRAEDGITLRYRFADEYEIEDIERYITEPCSVLEMMIFLAIRCEETIMDDPGIGDRTRQWFWNMVINLGLGSMTDDNYDKRSVTDILERFLNREYEPDGTGGLFVVNDRDCDLRDVEIWHQLCWYLDSIT